MSTPLTAAGVNPPGGWTGGPKASGSTTPEAEAYEYDVVLGPTHSARPWIAAAGRLSATGTASAAVTASAALARSSRAPVSPISSSRYASVATRTASTVESGRIDRRP